MKIERKSNGLGFGSVLFLIFLTLKLTGHIAWSWWWVTAPLWVPLGLAGIAILIVIYAAVKNS